MSRQAIAAVLAREDLGVGRPACRVLAGELRRSRESSLARRGRRGVAGGVEPEPVPPGP
jgi:hypothetical protein